MKFVRQAVQQLLIVVIFTCTLFASDFESDDVNAGDKEVLLALYESTGGPDWDITWDLTQSPREWYGVEVSDEGRVTSINLQSNRLIGTIPDEITNLPKLETLFLRGNRLSGAIPSTIGDLSELETLNLRLTRLSGEIPSSIGDLTKLTNLDLSANNFSGSIPVEIGTMVAMTSCDLAGNSFSGAIPNEFGSLTSLAFLDLSDNALSGSIPTVLGMMSSLQELDLGDNQLTGSIPVEIGDVATLEELRLNGNLLTGAIPSQLGNLTNLEHFNAQGNRLSGSIPSTIGNLVELGALELIGNELTGTIPSEIGDLTNLTRLFLTDNQLTGSIPATIANLTNLDHLDLSENQLTGAVPDLTPITSLGVLELDNNQLTALPDLSSITTFRAFLIHNNQFNFEDIVPNISVVDDYSPQIAGETESVVGTAGTIMLAIATGTYANNAFQWYKDGVAITGATNSSYSFTYTDAADAGNYRVDVTNSQATALTISKSFIVIPDGVSSHPDFVALEALYTALNGSQWTNKTNWLINSDLSTWHGITLNGSNRVSEIDLSVNRLEGELPSEIGDLTELTRLDLNENSALTTTRGLFGSLPTEIGNLTNLTYLNLRDCSFSGELPDSFWSLTSLQDLNLGRNNFQGMLPADLGNLNSLTSLILRKNDFHGSIPAEIGDLTALTSLEMWSNDFSGSIPSEIGNLTSLTNFQIGNNSLSGEIPEELFDLTNLQILVLLNNNLSGNIHPSIGDLSQLWYLDMAMNNLNGSLPPEIGDLSSLTWLQLYNNDLSGPIPDEIGNLSNLIYLIMYNNSFSGDLPDEINNLTELLQLRLSFNELTGGISEGLVNLTKLTNIELNHNRLTGSIPDIFGSLGNLTVLDAQTNALTGELPSSIWTLDKLQRLEFSHNQLTGEVPVEIADLTALTSFGIMGNNFEGQIPEEIAELANLQIFMVGGNQFRGTFPPFSTSQTQITSINIENNFFDELPDFSIHGGIPQITVRYNNLGFGDLIPQENLFLTYSPQNKVDDEIDAFVNEGEMYTMEVSEQTDGNTYQWEKDGVRISGAVSSTYAIDDFDASDEGTYTVKIRNAGLTRQFLELERNDVNLSLNTGPTDITLNTSNIDENNALDDVIGAFTIVDAEDTEFTLSISGTDVAQFDVDGDNLIAKAAFNYEDQSSFNITVTATDKGGLTVSDDFIIDINDLNEAPESVTLSSTSIQENNAIDDVIGNFEAVDADDDTYTYTLSGTDAKNFTISGSELKAREVFNFESKTSFEITVNATDSEQNGLSTDFTIDVTDANDAPSSFALDNSTVDENQVVGVVIGTFSGTDDDDDVFTYELSGTDAAFFEVSEGQLVSNSVFDHENISSYTFTVTILDDENGSFSEDVNITILDINDAPEAVSLSITSIDENVAAETLIGEVTASDQDGDDLTFTLSGEDADQFSLVDTELFTVSSLDFEVKPTYEIIITAADPDGLTASESITIQLQDVNDTPTSVSLSNSSVAELEAVGTIVGAIEVEDVDDDSWTYDLSGVDAAAFTVSGADLVTSEIFDREEKATYTLTITATDVDGLSVSDEFIIDITNVNEAPSVLTLTSTTISENQSVGTIVGTLEVTDDSDQIGYELSGTDASAFEIEDGQLKSVELLDFEIKSTCEVNIKASDDEGLFIEESFVISVGNVNESPSELTLDNLEIETGSAVGTLVGELTAEDPENDEITFQLTGTNADLFTITDNQLLTAEIFTDETPDELEISVTATDPDGLSSTETFIISILKTEAPLNTEILDNIETHIYPNPARDQLTVTTLFSRNLSWSFSDLAGKNYQVAGVVSSRDGKTTIKMDVEALNGGIYLLKLSHRDGFLTRVVKVVK